MTKAALVAALSITSMIVSSFTSAMTSRLSGLPGRFAHFETGLLGSASIMVTRAPFPASSVASTTAEVDLPAPPLGLANTMVGMGPRCMRKGNDSLASCSQTVISVSTANSDSS